jgi:uncharacterized protein
MLLFEAKYIPPFIFRNKHLHTIAPAIFRKVNIQKCNTEEIITPDNDFIEIDHYSNNNNIAAILTHGIEGNSRKPYMLGMINVLLDAGIDAIAINLRGCSGKDNHLLSSYHAGKTDDLSTVINFVIQKYKYQQIVLIGFSLGANITLKYVGESGNQVPSVVKAAIGISVPCDLASTSIKLSSFSNQLYLNRFLKSLKSKAINKIKKFKIDNITEKDILKTRNFCDFDSIFTAPVHDFESAQDYWTKCSSKQFMKNICIPTYILNALDDPMLSIQSYPFDECRNHAYVFFETPHYGGHVGFTRNLKMNQIFYHEIRVIDFLKQNLLIS